MGNVYFDGEAEATVNRISNAVACNPVTVEDLVRSAEFLAACTQYGLTVTDVLRNGINSYPHIKAMMGEYWDARPEPETLKGEPTNG